MIIHSLSIQKSINLDKVLNKSTNILLFYIDYIIIYYFLLNFLKNYFSIINIFDYLLTFFIKKYILMIIIVILKCIKQINVGFDFFIYK